MERIGERLIEARSSQAVARDLRRRLLVWRQRHDEHVKRFERFERQYVRRFGRDGLPSGDMPLALRVEVLEHELDQRLR